MVLESLFLQHRIIGLKGKVKTGRGGVAWLERFYLLIQLGHWLEYWLPLSREIALWPWGPVGAERPWLCQTCFQQLYLGSDSPNRNFMRFNSNSGSIQEPHTKKHTSFYSLCMWLAVLRRLRSTPLDASIVLGISVAMATELPPEPDPQAERKIVSCSCNN